MTARSLSIPRASSPHLEAEERLRHGQHARAGGHQHQQHLSTRHHEQAIVRHPDVAAARHGTAQPQHRCRRSDADSGAHLPGQREAWREHAVAAREQPPVRQFTGQAALASEAHRRRNVRVSAKPPTRPHLKEGPGTSMSATAAASVAMRSSPSTTLVARPMPSAGEPGGGAAAAARTACSCCSCCLCCCSACANVYTGGDEQGEASASCLHVGSASVRCKGATASSSPAPASAAAPPAQRGKRAQARIFVSSCPNRSVSERCRACRVVLHAAPACAAAQPPRRPPPPPPAPPPRAPPPPGRRRRPPPAGAAAAAAGRRRRHQRCCC